MKRFHVHVSVEKIDEGIRFYATIFGAEPALVKSDYAKWMLDDPRINFAISSRGRDKGVNHLGFQVDTAEDLEVMRVRLERADKSMIEEQGISCCYASSDKYWVTDPAGIAWETFRSLGTVPIYGENHEAVTGAACCEPSVEVAPAQRKCCA